MAVYTRKPGTPRRRRRNEKSWEVRRPKTESRKKAEIRSPNARQTGGHSDLGLRVSFGLRLRASAADGCFVREPFALPQHRRLPRRPFRPAEKLTYPALTYEPPAQEQFRVTLKNGPVAYVVPDRELPLVNIVVYAHTGEYLEPAGKEGLAELTGYLLARGGTKSKTAEALEERLAFLAAQLNSGIGENQGSVSLNLLAKDLDEGLAILREVLTAPRFQDDKIALRKQQMLQSMKERNDESAAIEGREQGFLAFGENFWANHYSTAASVDSHHPRRPGEVPPAMVPSRQLRRGGQR